MSKALEHLLRPRLNVFMRKNLDGTYTVSAAPANPYRNRITLKMQGYNLEACINSVTDQCNVAEAECRMVL